MLKIKQYYNILCIVFLFLFFFKTSFSSEISSLNLSKINKCVACHTITGKSNTSVWPKISEQHHNYMLKQLKEYKKGKDGNRFDPTMFGMLKDIDEEELSDLAKHYSNQKLSKNKKRYDRILFDKGKEIYLFGNKDKDIVGCVGCHGIDGMGNNLAKFPVLKWQYKEYIITQMNKFKSNDRSNDINSIMRDIVKNMTIEQINDVALYISYME